MSKRIDFDKYRLNYNKILNEKTQFFSSNEDYFAKYKIDMVACNLTSTPKRVLEYGCGIGRNIPFLQSAFPHAAVYGSDIASDSLEQARADNPGALFFNENKPPADLEPFDLVFVSCVYHHIAISDRLNVTNTLMRRMAPSGNLFIFEHNPYNPITRYIVNSCPYDADAILLKPRELIRLLQESGLKIFKTSFCLFIPPRFSMLIGVEKILKWLPLGGQYMVHAGPIN